MPYLAKLLFFFHNARKKIQFLVFFRYFLSKNMRQSRGQHSGILLAMTMLIIVCTALPPWPDATCQNLRKSPPKAVVGEYIPRQDIAIERTMAFAESDRIYRQFRSKYRFQYQTIASKSFTDSSRMLIISEPAPFFRTDTIGKIFRDLNHCLKIRRHKVGYDGHITDIIVTFANATDDNIAKRLPVLAKALYLSDYKPFTENLDNLQERKYFSEKNIDYRISLEEFNDWFLVEKEAFISNRNPDRSLTVRNLLSQKARGVFFSREPGFVAWALPKNADIRNSIPDIRRFALDADLILGAFADKSTLVIIGRERESALNTLPPLQVETVMLLASISKKELAQSLDINDFLAGKLPDGTDWCPTYLSKELENTEFGHLMTITDILLKNWSENGTVKEFDYRYPAPGHYPFDRPLFRKLGLDELVYNWNTADVMYAIDTKGLTIYTLNRTGSLPVSYFLSQEKSTSAGRQYEEQAYQYFSTLGNTDLARVVQYVALYQLFMDNGIRCQSYRYSAFPKNKPYLLLKPTREALSIFKNLTAGETDYLADSVSRKVFREFHKPKIDEQIQREEAVRHQKIDGGQRSGIYTQVQNNIAQNLRNRFAESQNMLKKLSLKDFEKLCKALAYPRGGGMDKPTYDRLHNINDLVRNIGKNNLPLIGIDLERVRDYFSQSLSNSGARYLKTPSLIMTYNNMYTTGGHNISSKISRVNRMSGYKDDRTADSPATRKSAAAPDSGQAKGKAKNPTVPDRKSPARNRVHDTGNKPAGNDSNAECKSAENGDNATTHRKRSEVVSSDARTHRGFQYF